MRTFPLPRTRSIIQVCLNILFCVWVMYFLATGYLLPAPLLRDPPRQETIEVLPPMDDEVPALPPDFPEES